jgi:hypothetical protein
MVDFASSSLAVFSRSHCGAICAFLIPANIGLASAVLAVTVMDRPQQRIRLLQCSGLAAIAMGLHVGTWLAVGVIHLFTFVLLGLALTCLVVDGLTWRYPQTVREHLLRLLAGVSQGLSLQQVENWLKTEIIR